MKAEDIKLWLKENLWRFDVPEAYLGDEPNSEHRDWDSADLRVCFIGGGTYEGLVGNLGVPILVKALAKARPNVVVERAFFPNSEREYKILNEEGIPIFSLESKHPINEFDLIGFSCSYQLVDINVIQMLRMSGLNTRSVKRGDEDPIVIRGGANYSNPMPWADIYDMCFCGEAEEAIVKIVDLIKRAKELGWSKNKILYAMGCKIRGAFVPRFYKEKWENGKLVGWDVLKEGLPKVIQREYVRDLNKSFIYDTPIVNYVKPMGSGELLISRGCQARCSFCNEGVVNKPYRELDVDKVVAALKKSMIESGSPGVVCSAFCSSSHTQKKMILYRLLTEVSDRVQLLSQRCDEFSEDEEFAILTGMGGNKSVSLGVEGPSERARRLCDKHAHENHILKATELAIKAGYKKIKYFMISSMPTVTDEDRLELLDLAKKIMEVVDKFPDRKPHLHLRFNWTELRNADHTAFQWAKPTIGARTLNKVLKPLTEMGFKVGFGAHKTDEVDLWSQLSFLGDRRLSEPWIKMVEENDIIYLRGFKSNVIDLLKEYMEAAGLKIEDYIRERSYDEVLPWDIIDVGVTKESLWKQYQGDLNDTGEWPKCSEKCSNCGACTKEDFQIRSNILNHKDEIPVSLDKIKIIRLKGTMGHLRMKVKYDMEHRFIRKSARASLFRRACYKVGVPISMMQVRMASNLIKSDDWIAGRDYIDIALYKPYFNDEVELKRQLNEYLTVSGIEIEELMIMSAKAGQLNMAFDLCFYSMEIPPERVDEVVDRIDWFKEQKPVLEPLPQDGSGKERSEFIKKYPTVIRVAQKGFSGVERVLVDLKTVVDDVWVVNDEGQYKLRLLVRGFVNCYHFLGLLLPGEKYRKAQRLRAERVEYFAHREDDQYDFERGFCSKCSQKVAVDLFNNSYGSSDLCPKHYDEEMGLKLMEGGDVF